MKTLRALTDPNRPDAVQSFRNGERDISGASVLSAAGLEFSPEARDGIFGADADREFAQLLAVTVLIVVPGREWLRGLRKGTAKDLPNPDDFWWDARRIPDSDDAVLVPDEPSTTPRLLLPSPVLTERYRTDQLVTYLRVVAMDLDRSGRITKAHLWQPRSACYVSIEDRTGDPSCESQGCDGHCLVDRIETDVGVIAQCVCVRS